MVGGKFVTPHPHPPVPAPTITIQTSVKFRNFEELIFF